MTHKINIKYPLKYHSTKSIKTDLGDIQKGSNILIVTFLCDYFRFWLSTLSCKIFLRDGRENPTCMNTNGQYFFKSPVSSAIKGCSNRNCIPIKQDVLLDKDKRKTHYKSLKNDKIKIATDLEARIKHASSKRKALKETLSENDKKNILADFLLDKLLE